MDDKQKARPVDGPGATFTAVDGFALLLCHPLRAQIAPTRRAVVMMRVMVQVTSKSGDHGTQPKAEDTRWARENEPDDSARAALYYQRQLNP